MRKVGVISLGCDKNRVDTEKMLFGLAQKGYTFTPEPAKAQIIIINTCAFLNSARKEAIETILEMSEYKKRGLEKLVVTGCLPAKYMSELRDSLPEADLLLGCDSYHNIGDLIELLYDESGEWSVESGVEVGAGLSLRAERSNPADVISTGAKRSGEISTAENSPPSEGCPSLRGRGGSPSDIYIAGRKLTTPSHYAYLKISEGCSNRCSYCTIPSIRGAYRQYQSHNLIAEARTLASYGIKELILVAQDVTAYDGLTGLINELEKIGGIEWIRLMYCYPERITDALIEKIASSGKVCKYIDIPFQHADDGILRSMNRRTTFESAAALVNKLRTAMPGISIRTSFITGFPGETEEAFEKLCNFVTIYKFNNAGFFIYSREEGTPAHGYPGQIPLAVKRRRLRRLAELQKTAAAELNSGFIGKTLRVLCDGIDYGKNLFAGRTEYNAPEVDGKVYFKAKFANTGDFYCVKITGVSGYDLKGEHIKI